LLAKSNEELIEFIQKDIDVTNNMEQLYKQNHGFIFTVARKRVSTINDIDDLMQIGFLGLVSAVKDYDAKREKCKFLNLLKFSILREISKIETDIPAWLKAAILKYKKTYDSLYAEFGQAPTDTEMRAFTGIDRQQQIIIKRSMKQNVSIDTVVGDDESSTLKDYIPDEEAHLKADEELHDEELKKILHDRIEKLQDGPKEVMIKRYYDNHSRAEVIRQTGYTPDKVRRLEIRAMQELRSDKHFKAKLEGYLEELNDYMTVGVSAFQRTHTSSVEILVIKRDEIERRQANKTMEKQLAEKEKR